MTDTSPIHDLLALGVRVHRCRSWTGGPSCPVTPDRDEGAIMCRYVPNFADPGAYGYLVEAARRALGFDYYDATARRCTTIEGRAAWFIASELSEGPIAGHHDTELEAWVAVLEFADRESTHG